MMQQVVNEPTHNSRFPLFFEVLVWFLYVGLYKYASYTNELETAPSNINFPHPQLIIYAIATSVYLIPYYRWLIPHFIKRKQYVWLVLSTLFYFALLTKVSNLLVNWLFLHLPANETLTVFYGEQFALSVRRISAIGGWNLYLLLTDFITFSCIAFVRYSFENEEKRHQAEKSNLLLQLNILKNQLQPHFLFNTLNGLYAMSLSNSRETSHFILLVSEMMRYILYEGSKELVPVQQEITFLKNYFEMEQKKYPGATISFTATYPYETEITLPPLLFLPLVENSFKHGAHRFQDQAQVKAHLTISHTQVRFVINNDLPDVEEKQKPCGIGLVNIGQRLHIYYPQKHKLLLTQLNGQYNAELVLDL